MVKVYNCRDCIRLRIRRSTAARAAKAVHQPQPCHLRPSRSTIACESTAALHLGNQLATCRG